MGMTGGFHLSIRCWQASILGAVAGAHFARAVAPAYGIPVSLDMLGIYLAHWSGCSQVLNHAL